MPRALGLKEVADPFVEDQQKGLLPEGPEDAGVELGPMPREFILIPNSSLVGHSL